MMESTQRYFEEIPVQLGRYRVTSSIGFGDLAVVYRAWDDQLRRDVAIKVPQVNTFFSPSEIDEYLAEARNISHIDYPGIVPIYDVGRTDDGRCFVVTKFMSAGNLADRLTHDSPSAATSVDIVIPLARTLQFAHKNGLVHGHLHSANVLFDDQGRPCLCDFGTPPTDADRLVSRELAGPLAFQSPEQLRGEQHRIDGRTDIYSLGAILFELLAGRWPLRESRRDEMIRRMMQFDSNQLSDVKPALPPELIRICQKALARRIVDRYTTVLDFAEDLEQCRTLLPASGASKVSGSTTTVANPRIRSGNISKMATGTVSELAATTSIGDAEAHVVPKGLRSFDQEDADFFLQLLPGARGRDGLPESVRFWKGQIEEVDPAVTFRVGLIYGPSGCGKSSLVKAGILPRLDDYISPIYLEATPQGTESRLLAALRRRCPQLPTDCGLTESIAELRRGKTLVAGQKLLIVLDQFEQWLHANRDLERPELSAALRQCDGKKLQCIVMVRDDFWMAVTRFLHDLDIKLVEGHNSACVDLFGLAHARRVLIDFGRAFECLPHYDSEQTAEEKAFIDQAVDGLAHDGKVISVQLALFAEMVKNKPWKPSTLKEIGGAEGIGLAFLEETFSAAHAPPQHRRHQRATREILKLLLPEQGADIKGQMRSRDELLAASGYLDRPHEFDELIQILDQELRLVTPADPEGVEDGEAGGRTEKQATYFQLTHDFLVPSVRRWLVRKQQQTSSGRAELLLEEKAATWNLRPERTYLPTWWQTLKIRLLTRRRDWSRSQQAMMRSAIHLHTVRTAVLVAFLICLCWGGVESIAALTAYRFRDRLMYAHVADVPQIIHEAAGNRRWVNRVLRREAASVVPHSAEDLRIRLALLPDDKTQIDPLFAESLTTDDETFSAIADALSPHAGLLTEQLWATLESPTFSHEWKLRASQMLARYSAPKIGDSPGRWAGKFETVAECLHAAAVADPRRFQPLVKALAPIGNSLIAPLRDRSRDLSRSESDRAIAANILIEYASARPDILTEVMLEAQNPEQQAAILSRLQPMTDEAVSLLEPELFKRPEDLKATWNDVPLTDNSTVAAAVVTELESADGMVTERFAFCQTLPQDHFLTVADGLTAAGYRVIRFRRYAARDSSLVCALWTRDGRQGRVEQDLTESEIQAQIAGPRLKNELLVDLAAFETPAKEIHHTAVWADRRAADPETVAYIGAYSDEWHKYRESRQQEGFAAVSLDFRINPTDDVSLSAVFWKGKADRTWELRPPAMLERDLTGEIAGKEFATIDLCPTPHGTRADARMADRLSWVSVQEKDVKARSTDLMIWIYLLQHRILVRQDEKAIEDATYFIEHGGEKRDETWALRMAHDYRSFCAARLGWKADAARFLEEASTALGNDEFANSYRKKMAELFAGQLHGQPEEMKKFCDESPTSGWNARLAAQMFAVAARLVRDRDPDRARAYTDQAIDYLQQATIHGSPSDVWTFLNDPYIDAIIDDPRIMPLQIAAEMAAAPAMKFALQGDAPRARAELVALIQKGEDASAILRTEFVVDALLGEEERAQTRLEKAIVDLSDYDPAKYWGAVGAYSLGSCLLQDKNPARAKAFADSAFALLDVRTQQHSGRFLSIFRRELLIYWLFAPLRTDPRMTQILAKLDRQSSLTLTSDSAIDSQLLQGIESAEHLKKCRELVAQGFRPTSLDACFVVGSAIPVGASVWQRPRATQEQRDRLAKRQSIAAAALVRLGSADTVWPLLKLTPDLRLRSWLIQMLGPAGADPRVLATRLDSETDVSIRRAIVLALGRTAYQKLSEADRTSIANRLAALFRDDPDPGIHSAAEWTLKKWEQKLTLAKEPLLTRSDPARPWSVNAHGDVLVTIEGPLEFSMGSPLTELDREANETRHRRRINRSFAVATKEVSIRQFERFLKDNPQIKYEWDKSTSTDADCPAGSLTWYQAAAYCRWLSVVEGIPEDEIGFPPLDQIRAGMQLKPYFLSRSGYRFPTEAEWEFACRAGATTRWPYGNSFELLSQYAWFKENSQGRSWPTGKLMPNDLGLFDMLGNIQEMCLSCLTLAKTNVEHVDDAYTTQRSPNHISERGASFQFEGRHTRPGFRRDGGTWAYENIHVHNGFRIVRSILPPELLEARRLRRLAAELRNNGNPSDADRSTAQAMSFYERLLASHPENPDYPWELSEYLLDGSGAVWQVLEPVEATSREGTTLNRQPDGSILASGKSPDNDLYSLRFETRIPSIAAIKLDVLTDPTFPNGGPGRSVYNEGGNFHLGEVRVQAGPSSDPAQLATVPIVNAFTDFAQANTGQVTDAIDGNNLTIWAVAPFTGRPHWAVFELANPISNQAGSQIVMQLDFADTAWKRMTLGRFRISATEQLRPAQIDEWRRRLGDSSLSGWMHLAAAYVLLGKPDAAKAAIAKAPKDPCGEFVDDRFLMALIHRELGQPDEAKAWLERGLARFDASKAESNLKQLAGDAAIIALEQEPPDLSLLNRIAKMLGINALIRSGAPDADFTRARIGKLAKLGIGGLEFHLRLGKWEQSSTAILTEVEKTPDQRLVWLRAATVLVQANKADAYRELCRKMLLRFSSAEVPAEADVICKACSLLAGAVAVPPRLLEVVERGFTTTKDREWFLPWGMSTLALANYRAEDSDSALVWASKSFELASTLPDPHRSQIRAISLAVQALVRTQRSETDAAHVALQAARELIPQELQQLMSRNDDGLFVAAESISHDWMVPEILCREAEANLAGKTFTWVDVSTIENNRLLDQLPKNSVGWGSERGALFRKLSSRNDGVMEKLMALRPNDIHLRIGWTRHFATEGDWQQAFTGYTAFINTFPVGDEWCEYAAICLILGKTQEFESFIERIAPADGTAPHRFHAFTLARTAALGANKAIDPQRLVEWAELPSSGEMAPWYPHLAGLAQYRAGNDDAALKRIQQSIDMGNWTQGTGINHLVMALALHRMGQHAQARQHLAKAHEWGPDAKLRVKNGTFIGSLSDWLEFEVLRREAETKLTE